MTAIQFLAGLTLLVVGAEALVRGASRLAAAAGLSPLVIGLTVVAFGTSAPELAVTVKAALADQSAVSLGNVVGSNTFNVLVILGLSAVIAPLPVSSQLVRIDVPLMIGVSLAVVAMASDGAIGRLDGALLGAGLAAYTGGMLIAARRTGADQQFVQPAADAAERRGLAVPAALTVGGLALLVIGSRWFVDSAIVFAQTMGVSEVVIGLTIVAAGTSLPEVVTSAVASVRGERDIAVGNVVGSNLFNLLGVLGVAGLVAPHGIEVSPAVFRFDLPVMTAVAVACLPIFFTGMAVSRWEGALLLGYYGAYVAYLWMAATQHAALPAYSGAMLLFVVPVTAATLAITTIRAWRIARQNDARQTEA